MKVNEGQYEAVIVPIKKISPIWFVPLVAVLIGLWMLFYQWSNQGTEITLDFLSAEGMEIGKTKVKIRSIDVGVVTNIEINEQSSGVIVTARIIKSAEKLLVEDSLFWLVSPKVTLKEITGLDTLLSGVYIQLAAGKSENYQKHFVSLPYPPVTPLGTPGLHITLNSKEQFAYQVGDPIIYKGLNVGKIEDVHFNFEERVVYYNAFIKAPYHQLITSNTKFWDISGVRLDLNSKGLTVNTGSIDSLLTNGVTFGVLNEMQKGEMITDRAFFDIFLNYESAETQRYRKSIELLLLVDNSIRGLNEGAIVEYKGIPVGQVSSINVIKEVETQKTNETNPKNYVIPVLMKIEPARFGFEDSDEGVNAFNKLMDNWLINGFSAKLQTGNILTGNLFVNLIHQQVDSAKNIQISEGYRVIPTIDDDLSQIAAKASEFLDNLNDMPLRKIAYNANNLIEELTLTSQELQKTSLALSGVLTNVEKEKLTVKLANALNNIAILTKDLSAESKIYKDADSALLELNNLMYELEPLINQLNKQPNSLIFNKGKMQDLEPKKYSGQNK